MPDPTSLVAEAFSRKAQVYDEFGAGHINLEHMRQKVRRHVVSYLRPGDRILELNAGTGSDAVFFARLGYQVWATDIAPDMIAKIEAKVRQENLQESVTVRQVSFDNLEQLSSPSFRCIFSNMGGINCTGDLAPLVRGIRTRLAPGGFVTLVVMPPFCPWELGYALRGDFKTGLRRFHRNGVLANVEGVQFMTYYYMPTRLEKAFGPDFHRLALEGLSVFTPPADHKDFPVHHPRLYRFLRILDDHLSGIPPFNRWGDFTILTLRYLPGKAG